MIFKKLIACVAVGLLISALAKTVEAEQHHEVHTLPATNITKNSATLHGTVSEVDPAYGWCECPCSGSFMLLDANGARIRGFGTVGAPGSFSGTWEDLIPGTTYRFCAYIYAFYQDYCCDYSWGEVLSFTTLPADRPRVSTEAATEIGETSARLWGRIDDDGGEPCRYRVRYKKSGGSYVERDWAGSVTTGALFSEMIWGLAPASTYYFSVQAQNSAGESEWGDELSFVTPGKCTLIVSSSTGGHVSVPGEGWFSYDPGSSVPVLATSEANYHFVNWTGTAVSAGRVANPNSEGTTVTMDADYTVQANFVGPACGDGQCSPGEDWHSCPEDCPPPKQPPVACFKWSPDKPMTGENAEFDASCSSDSDGRIVSYLWDYGDGNTEGTVSPVVEHAYERPGQYTVALTVTDDDGLSDTAQGTVTVVSVTDTRRQFMITFDDGPVPGNTGGILNALKNIKVDGEPVRAGFFMVGVGCCEDATCYCLSPNQLPSMGSVRSNPDLVRMVAQAGHIIGVHTQHHPWFGQWSVNDIKREISTCLEEIKKAVPEANITTFRPPYLCAVPNVVQAAKELGLQVVLGVGENEDASIDSGGRRWTKARSLMGSSDEVYPCVLTFHDTSSDIASSIADIVAYLRNRGFVLVHFGPDRIPHQVQTVHTLSGIANCPVDLVVTDPAGLVLSKEQKAIPDGVYEELDVDGDGDLEDSFLVPDARLGQYLVYVIPDPNALPNETYSVEVSVDGQSSVLARDVLVKDAPQDPYKVPVPPPAPLPDPVARWTFDEGTGWSAYDSIGGIRAGISGELKWTEGVLGGALYFNGRCHADSTSAAVLNPEKLTITGWSMTEQIGVEQNIVARGPGYDMGYDQDYLLTYSADGRMKFYFGESWGQNVKVVTEPIEHVDRWVHVAAVRDGSQAILYLDGKPVASKPYSYVPVNHGGFLTFGAGLKGKIDDVRIYDRPLSAEQIQTLYGQR